MSKKYIPKKKKGLSSKEIKSKKNFQEVLRKVTDEQAGKLIPLES